jgi:hypothetical protein
MATSMELRTRLLLGLLMDSLMGPVGRGVIVGSGHWQQDGKDRRGEVAKGLYSSKITRRYSQMGNKRRRNLPELVLGACVVGDGFLVQ